MLPSGDLKYVAQPRFLGKALLGYLAYITLFPTALVIWLNKLRGVRVSDTEGLYIAPMVLIDSLYPELVTLERGVYLTRGVRIITHFNPTPGIAEIIGTDRICGPVSIRESAFVGVGAIVLPNVTIGRCALVGAGAVVTEDVPDYAIVGGNPARVIGDVRKRDWSSAKPCGPDGNE